MASFTKGGAVRTPFGKNEWRRSTKDVKFESYTLAASTITAQTIDGFAGQKVVQSGIVMAKITSGGDAGKVGPFQGQASTTITDGRQTLTNIVGICDTFLPYQTMDRDVEIAVAFEAAAVQAWCLEYANDGSLLVLTNTTAAAMVSQKSISIIFK